MPPSDRLAQGAGEAAFAAELAAFRACTICARHLPLGPRPIVRASTSARLLIVSQAPGTRVHMTGLTFNDRSGDRLREWLGIGRGVFYDETRVAILPMGGCYPGRDAGGGDLPPRPECAPHWHGRLLSHMPQVELTVLAGSYAIAPFLGSAAKTSMTDTVKAWREYLPRYFPLPHPSWRNTAWLARHPWFARELLPQLRRRVRALV